MALLLLSFYFALFCFIYFISFILFSFSVIVVCLHYTARKVVTAFAYNSISWLTHKLFTIKYLDIYGNAAECAVCRDVSLAPAFGREA